MDYYSYTIDDYIVCEAPECSKKCASIHHIIKKSQGGGDNIDNLIGLCIPCHHKAENDKDFNNELKLQKETEFLI